MVDGFVAPPDLEGHHAQAGLGAGRAGIVVGGAREGLARRPQVATDPSGHAYENLDRAVPADEIQAAVTSYIASVNGNDKAAFLAHFAPDAVWHDPVGSPPHVGQEGIGAFWDQTRSMAQRFEMIIDDLVVCGDEAAALAPRRDGEVDQRGDDQRQPAAVGDLERVGDEERDVRHRQQAEHQGGDLPLPLPHQDRHGQIGRAHV